MSNILLVDDDEDMIRLTANWLKRAGHEVFTATSGQEALDFLSAAKPDLIVLDYAMPGMDGPATLEAIKASESTKNIPVLFRTGMEDGSINDVMEKLSPAGVVPKSEGKSSLLNAVSDILG